MKWTVLGDAENLERYRLLSRTMAEAGVPNEFETWVHRTLDFETFAELADFEHVRLAREWSLAVPKNIKFQSSWTATLGMADGMIKRPEGWWPQCGLYESFRQLLELIANDLDASQAALIAGAGAAARTAVAGLFKSGLNQFVLTNIDEAEGHAAVKDITRRFLGLKIEFVPREKIVLLPAETSVFVNCTPQVEQNLLLAELCYLNFLKRPGIMIDLSLAREFNPLIVEALDSGVRVFGGADVAARTDVYWAKNAFNCNLSLESYLPRMIQELKLKPIPRAPNS